MLRDIKHWLSRVWSIAANEEPEYSDEPCITSEAMDYWSDYVHRLDDIIHRELFESVGPRGLVTKELLAAYLKEHLRFKGEPFA